jgi:hypothetical protein
MNIQQRIYEAVLQGGVYIVAVSIMIPLLVYSVLMIIGRITERIFRYFKTN